MQKKKKNEWKCNELRLTTCGVERGRIFVRGENQRERERENFVSWLCVSQWQRTNVDVQKLSSSSSSFSCSLIPKSSLTFHHLVIFLPLCSLSLSLFLWFHPHIFTPSSFRKIEKKFLSIVSTSSLSTHSSCNESYIQVYGDYSFFRSKNVFSITQSFLAIPNFAGMNFFSTASEDFFPSLQNALLVKSESWKRREKSLLQHLFSTESVGGEKSISLEEDFHSSFKVRLLFPTSSSWLVLFFLFQFFSLNHHLFLPVLRTS